MRLLNWAASLGRVPVVPLMGYPGVRLNGFSVREALNDAAAHVSTIEALAEKFMPDAVFALMDLTVEAEAAGIPVTMPEDRPPSTSLHPIKSIASINSLNRPDPSRDGRMPSFAAAVSMLKERLDIPVGAYVIGPFTLAGEMAGAEHLATSTIRDRAFVEGLLSFTTVVIKDYAYALCEAGADLVIILEPTPVILSPASFERYSFPYICELAELIRRGGASPILHVCGESTHIIPEMIRTGVEGLSLDSPIDMAAVAEAVPSDLFLIGNIAPVEVMLEKGPEAVRAEVDALRSAMGCWDNFIFSSGCDLPLDTPFENIEALVERANGTI
ncbi:MAG: uroporphyrinogen decarboxylase family protein [Actinobacteria bacterium]|nr:uroporphyrinogen decarboxylase family protein [Actinomycetota bacterium]